ncbi:hypothetical protein LSTR_LSTR010938 [Laodelphax striatellus]|uniref:NF-kappa-B-repressing factor n=1 Tax=Laodelphax striatellus TaxID=195883 RepID=A0A482XVM8_LAOST|nr:hypothetical protein LSTR_LSTR010938 [Laodelphax striatellus]
MCSNTDWDIEKYRSDFDADDHWKLKKSFILAHKDRYPEEKLVCLAQVFYNVEFLGCRYPEKLMKLVEELSKDVAVDYREQKKNRLQRTFVAASDAAEAKAKGTSRRTEDTKKPDGKAPTFVQSRGSRNEFLRKEENQLSPENLQMLHKMRNISGPCGSIYIIVSSDPSQSYNNLQRTSSTWKMPLVHEINQEPKDQFFIWRCMTSFGTVTAITEGLVKNKTKTACCEYLMWKLQRHYYTLKIASSLTKEELSARDADVQKSDVLVGAAKEPEVVPDNIGLKMMKMMGWAGGGLGKNEQGIEKPVEATGVVSRSGLGFGGKFDFRKINQVLLQFKRDTDGPQELVFAKDFSNEERGQIHQAAKKYGLKSKSVGPKSSRQLFVSKDIYYNKMDPWKFMELYLSLKDKYYQKFELYPPIDSDLVLTEGVTYLGLEN